MKRLWIALFTLATLGVARASDIATTLHFSPDLAREANPLVLWFGVELKSLLVGNVLIVLFLLVGPLAIYACQGPIRLHPTPATLRDHVCLQLHGRKLPFPHFLGMLLFLVPFPRNYLQLLRVIGLALTWAVIAGSFAAVLAWWATFGWHWAAYDRVRTALTVHRVPLLETLAGTATFWLVALLHFRFEFGELRRGRGES